MSVNNEGTPTPGSVEAQALAELEKEGHTVEGKQPAAPVEAPKAPEAPKEEKKEEAPKPADRPADEEKKPDRSPTMVEAWKLKVAEDQKAGLEKDLTDLKAKVEELSKQKAPITSAQQEDIMAEIDALAKDNPDVNADFLKKFAGTILKKAEDKYKTSSDIEKTVKELQQDKQVQLELNQYNEEFDKDVVPLIKEFNLSGEALAQLKTTLKGYAFSETYAKVPLKEIFSIKQSEFNLSAPKKSGEGKSVKGRATDVVNVDDLSEEQFANLPADKVEEFMQKKSDGTWKRG